MIGIVTVLYNSEPVLDGFFKSLESQTCRDFILYVVDNNSRDKSLELSRRLAAESSFKTFIIPEKENWGVAKGNNLGISRALADGCDYILLANNDTEFAPDTIAVMLESIRKGDCDLVVPKTLYFDSRTIWCAGGGFGYKNPTYHRGRYCLPDTPEFCVRRQVDYAPTCFMLIKSEVFDTVGFMDEKYFVYFDDTDFVWRATKIHGFRLLYEPGATVLHKVSSSTKSAASHFADHYHHRNSAYFMNKYFPWHQRWSVYIYNTVYYFLRTVKHPSYPSIFKFLGYYREGLQMYRDARRDGAPGVTPQKDNI